MKTIFQFSFRTSFLSALGALVALGIAGPFMASGCSGEDTAPPAGGAPIAIESIRKEFETARCAAFVRCGEMPDSATCLSATSADQGLLQLLADVVYGTVTYDESAARACINAINSAGCDGLASTLSSIANACEGVFAGTIPEGGGCVTDQECQGKGTCDRSMCMGNGACCIGVCIPEVPLIALGGDCSMPGSSCVSDAYCETGGGQGGAAPTCEKRNDNGQPCSQVDACLEGQRCDTNGDSTCYKLSAEGQQCNPTISNGSCIRSDNWCDTTEKKCVKLPGAGQPCADVNGNFRCLGYAYCDEMAMTCKSKLLEGEACMQGGPKCLGQLNCAMDPVSMMEVCTRPPPASVCVLDTVK